MFSRKGRTQVVTTKIDSLYLTETVEDAGTGTADIHLNVVSHGDESIDGVFLTLFLDDVNYAGGRLQIDNLKPVKLSDPESELNKYLSAKGKIFQFISDKKAEAMVGFFNAWQIDDDKFRFFISKI